MYSMIGAESQFLEGKVFGKLGKSGLEMVHSCNVMNDQIKIAHRCLSYQSGVLPSRHRVPWILYYARACRCRLAQTREHRYYRAACSDHAASSPPHSDGGLRATGTPETCKWTTALTHGYLYRHQNTSLYYGFNLQLRVLVHF